MKTKPVKEAELKRVLSGFYWDAVDYQSTNNLAGYNNHWMKEARKVLGLPFNPPAKKGKAALWRGYTGYETCKHGTSYRYWCEECQNG